MKAKLKSIPFILLSITIISCTDHKSPDAYLNQVLKNLEQIESANYTAIHDAWEPGDTTAVYRECKWIKEYNNPKDSTIGASYVSVDCDDTTKLHFGYDGSIRVLIYHEHKGLVIDDFTFRPLPFRPLNPPFFNHAKNIIRYALTTKDSITTDLKDTGDAYHFKLTIHEDKQVEFFGKAHYIDNQYTFGENTSIYELWIRKPDHLPYKIRREMAHSISATTCLNPEFNKLSIAGFNLYDYFPEDYEIRKYGEKANTDSTANLTGKKAPDWTLNDMNEQNVSLADLKSKVVLINFTGIGCGPCKAAIPLLNQLKEKYDVNDVEVISIETWRRNPLQLQNYANKNKINYSFLYATDEVVKQYQSGNGVPTFYLLDKDRIIRKVIRGYAKETTDTEITNAINELL